MKALTVICVSFCIFNVVCSTDNPGIIFKINSKGFELLNQIVSNISTSKLNSMTFGEFSAKVSGYNVTLNNIRLHSTDIWNTNLQPSYPNKVTLEISNPKLSVIADWEATKTVKLFGVNSWKKVYRYSGGIIATGTDVVLRQTIIIGKNTYGQPTFIPGICETTINDLSVKFFDSKIKLILNLLSKLFGKRIKRTVGDQVCSFLNKLIAKTGKEVTDKFKDSYPFIFNTSINLDLVKNPKANQAYAEAAVRGRCFSRKNPTQRFDFVPPEIPEFTPTSKMAQISISQYVLNTLLYSLWQDGNFERTFSLEELIKNLPIDELENSQSGNRGIVISSALPNLLQPRNNSVKLEIRALRAPKGSFHQNGITMNASFVVGVTSSLNGITNKVISVDFEGSITGKAIIQKSLLGIIITNITLKATSVSGLSNDFIDIINYSLSDLVTILMQPAITRVTDSGFKIPELFGFKAVDLAIQYKQNAIEISSNFEVV